MIMFRSHPYYSPSFARLYSSQKTTLRAHHLPLRPHYVAVVTWGGGILAVLQFMSAINFISRARAFINPIRDYLQRTGPQLESITNVSDSSSSDRQDSGSRSIAVQGQRDRVGQVVRARVRE